MKSIRVHSFGGPEVLKLEQLPDPTPAAGQVVVRAEAIGVNPVDTYIRSGIYGQRLFPFTPGTDAAGLIESVGPNVTNIKVGQRVYVFGSLTGAYAQRLLCTPQQVHPLPTRLSFEQGSAIGVPYGTAYRALFIRGQAKPAETILIHGGSGGVGTASIQLAKNIGMTIIATAGTEKGLESVLKQGADHALNHHQPDYLEQLMSITENRGVDLIIELLANVNLNKDLGVLRQARPCHRHRQSRHGGNRPAPNNGQGFRHPRHVADARRRRGTGIDPCRPGRGVRQRLANTRSGQTIPLGRRRKSPRSDYGARSPRQNRSCTLNARVLAKNRGEYRHERRRDIIPLI